MGRWCRMREDLYLFLDISACLNVIHIIITTIIIYIPTFAQLFIYYIYTEINGLPCYSVIKHDESLYERIEK